MADFSSLSSPLYYQGQGSVDIKHVVGFNSESGYYASLNTLLAIGNQFSGHFALGSVIKNIQNGRRIRLIPNSNLSGNSNISSGFDPGSFYYNDEFGGQKIHNLFYDDNQRFFIVANLSDIGNNTETASYIPNWNKYTFKGDSILETSTGKIYKRENTTGVPATDWTSKYTISSGIDNYLGEPTGNTNFVIDNDTGNEGEILLSFSDSVKIPKVLHVNYDLSDDGGLNLMNGKFTVLRNGEKYELESTLNSAQFTDPNDSNSKVVLDFARTETIRITNGTKTITIQSNGLITTNYNITTTGSGQINSASHITAGGNAIITGNTIVTGIIQGKNNFFIGPSSADSTNNNFQVITNVESGSISTRGTITMKSDGATPKLMIEGTVTKVVISRDFYIGDDATGYKPTTGAGTRIDSPALSVDRDSTDLTTYGNTFIRGKLLLGLSGDTDSIKGIDAYGNIDIRKVSGANNSTTGHSKIEGFGATGMDYQEASSGAAAEYTFDLSKGNTLYYKFSSVTDGHKLTIDLSQTAAGLHPYKQGSFVIAVSTEGAIGAAEDTITIKFIDDRFAGVDGQSVTIAGINDGIIYSGMVLGDPDNASDPDAKLYGSIGKLFGNLLA